MVNRICSRETYEGFGKKKARRARAVGAIAALAMGALVLAGCSTPEDLTGALLAEKAKNNTLQKQNDDLKAANAALAAANTELEAAKAELHRPARRLKLPRRICKLRWIAKSRRERRRPCWRRRRSRRERLWRPRWLPEPKAAELVKVLDWVNETNHDGSTKRKRHGMTGPDAWNTTGVLSDDADRNDFIKEAINYFKSNPTANENTIKAGANENAKTNSSYYLSKVDEVMIKACGYLV